jgi:hypothetical protein
VQIAHTVAIYQLHFLLELRSKLIQNTNTASRTYSYLHWCVTINLQMHWRTTRSSFNWNHILGCKIMCARTYLQQCRTSKLFRGRTTGPPLLGEGRERDGRGAKGRTLDTLSLEHRFTPPYKSHTKILILRHGNRIPEERKSCNALGCLAWTFADVL